ncbi:substrate-binding periplasmic protein [Alteromonas sp. CYL-A6]|uniref:substrate-binding periplasmic protein n=1 Tax=Alteromonas nitratireducens TaxID=3390813 RepID=UPI0034BF0377
MVLLYLLTLPAKGRESLAELTLYTETFPPYSFLDTGVVRGINADIVTRACDMAGITCHMNLVPWNRGMSEALKSANVGLFSTSRIDEREAAFLWVGPLVSSYSCFYRLKDRDDIQVTDDITLKQYTIGIQRGDIYQNVLNNMGLTEGVHYLTYSQKHQDARMFSLRKLDLMIGSSITLASQLASVNLGPEDVVPVLAINHDMLRGNYLALNKLTSPQLANALQQAIRTMKEDGSVDALVAQYAGYRQQMSEALPDRLRQCVTGTANY